jgi:DNA-binding NarL/FixJ family response regulator
MANLKILVVDKFYILRVGIITIINDNFKDIEFGEAENAEQAINLIGKNSWDIVILEIDLPDKHGMAVIDYIKMNYPDIKVLVLTALPEEKYALRIVKEGASYMHKDSTPAEVVRAIEHLKNGDQYISKKVASLLINEVSGKREKDIHTLLSNREFQIFLRLSVGKSLTAIAEELSLSVKTISTYRSHILRKMNFNNNADIIRYAIEKGFA